MDTKEEEDKASSPYHVLQQISEEAVRVAGEALQGVYSHSNSSSNLMGPRHRRSQSEVLTAGHTRTNSFQRFKCQMQRAWRWGGFSRENGYQSSFNPEDHTKYKEPTSLFEHFIIVGLHPEANLVCVEDAFARRKKWESEMAKSEMLDLRVLQYPGPSLPTLEPQILFKYPPGKKLAVRPKDLTAFCFPGGVKARLVERTPSLSDLNELVYGQEHLGRDDSSFIFSLKVADNATLYGVCLHVSEIVQRPPGILGTSPSRSQSSGRCSRFLVSAPRCYCLLTRVPFFELHFEMLNSIIAQERLNRITEFVAEMSLTDIVPSTPKLNDPINDSDSPEREDYNDWTASAIPVDSVVALTAAAAGIISDDEVTSSSIKISEPRTPESVTASEGSDTSQLREIDKDDRKNLLYFDDFASEASENRSDNLERMCATYENGHASPDVGTFSGSKTRTLERLASSESLFSPARSIASEEEDDEFFSNYEKDLGDDLIMEWARENKNDLLQIVCGYHALPLPAPGSGIVFLPLKHLQAIEYNRPPICALGICEKSLDSFKAAEVLALVAGVLLEKQVVVVCPNLGVLSAVVLSLIPMIRPFQWQSLLLPILPAKMLDFLEAPVPFIAGIQTKPADLKIKTSNLVQVNVLKDQVKSCHLPALPQQRELVSELRPIHARLSFESSIARRHPVYRCSEVQAEAAAQFLNVMGSYMESLCSDLSSHTITNVQSNNDRVSLLLKDSFIDSFPSRDRPFVKVVLHFNLSLP
ncbi:UDENN domain-containing protein [Citrus sinensis]|nr:UDENN domain-containing protein [Citrus sinensis]